MSLLPSTNCSQRPCSHPANKQVSTEAKKTLTAEETTATHCKLWPIRIVFISPTLIGWLRSRVSTLSRIETSFEISCEQRFRFVLTSFLWFCSAKVASVGSLLTPPILMREMLGPSALIRSFRNSSMAWFLYDRTRIGGRPEMIGTHTRGCPVLNDKSVFQGDCIAQG